MAMFSKVEEERAGPVAVWFGRFNIQKEVELWDRDAILGQARRYSKCGVEWKNFGYFIALSAYRSSIT
jgi:hypothetical protein